MQLCTMNILLCFLCHLHLPTATAHRLRFHHVLFPVLVLGRVRHGVVLTEASLPRYLNFLSLSSGASKVGILTGSTEPPVGRTITERFFSAQCVGYYVEDFRL